MATSDPSEHLRQMHHTLRFFVTEVECTVVQKLNQGVSRRPAVIGGGCLFSSFFGHTKKDKEKIIADGYFFCHEIKTLYQ